MRRRGKLHRLALCVGLGALDPLGTVGVAGSVGNSTVAAVIVGLVCAVFVWIISGDPPDTDSDR